MTPERERAIDLEFELKGAIIAFGEAQRGTVLRHHDDASAPAAALADADKHYADIERLIGELRALNPGTARRRRVLPTFAEMRINALRLLGDAQAELRSDWRDGTGPTRTQSAAMRAAMTAIGRATAALDRAAQR